MEFIKIVLFCIFAAIVYGVIHDLVTAHLCVEYFTIGHPLIFPLIHPEKSPTLLAIGWGIVATWWVGLFLGILAASAARLGSRKKATVSQVRPKVIKLLGVMAIFALIAGVMGYLLTTRRTISMPDFVQSEIPEPKQILFVADLWAHSASYLIGFLGGLVVVALIWIRRERAGEQAPLAPSDNI